MKTKEECLSESTNQGADFTVGTVYEAMAKFANQFKIIRTIKTNQNFQIDESRAFKSKRGLFH